MGTFHAMHQRNHDLHPFVAVSEILAPSAQGADALRAAFEDRLGIVDDREAFGGLEVWRDARNESRFLMVSWWRSREDMTSYLHSAEHDTSHARIPQGDLRPKGVRFERFEVVAT